MTIEKPEPNAIEKRELRSTHSKTFALSSGQFQCEVRRKPVCYVSDTGELRSCDTTVKQVDGRVFVEWLPYKFELHKTGIGFDFQSRDAGFASVKLDAIGDGQFDATEVMRPVIDANTIAFQDVRPGLDIVFEILPNRVKTFRVLKDEFASRRFTWICRHDVAGREKIDDVLIGEDASGAMLDLSTAIEQIDKSSYRFTESWSGAVKVRDKKTRIKSLSPNVSYPVRIDPTVSSSITATNQDGYENVSTSKWYSASNTKIYLGLNFWNPGFTFTSVNVPQGSTVTSATLTLNCLGTGSGGGAGKIYGQASDTAAVFTNSARPSQMSKTSASVNTGTISTTGSKAFTVTAIVQEVVNRAGWVANNNMNLAILLNAGGGYTTFEDYQNTGTSPASLSITYTAGGGGGTVGRIVTINQAVRRASTF